MFTKTVTYTDYNGIERTEKFHFNLNKAEIMKMETMTEGGLAEKIQKIVDANDIPAIMNIFEDLVLKAYGEKSDDGRQFRKKDANGVPLANAFAETEAYSMIYMELATNAEEAARFINGIIPADIDRAELNKALPESMRQ